MVVTLRSYYAEFSRRWARLSIHAWRTEALGNVATTAITVALTHRENGAWHTAAIALVANLIWFAVFATIHLIRTPWLLQSEGLPSEHLKQSSVLASLPVYRDDLRFELSAVCHGSTLDFHKTTLFLKGSLTCDSDRAITGIQITVTLDGKIYSGAPMQDLSGWVLHTPIVHKRYPYKNFERENLQALSLWRDVRENGLKSGILKEGWLGIEVPDATPKLLERVHKIRVDIISNVQREPYRFHFSKWPQALETVIDADFVDA